MNEHLQFDEDLELYALGALDADERNVFEAHLSVCETCKERLAEAQQRMAMVGATEPQVAPADHVKFALLQRVRETSHGQDTTPVVSSKRSFWSFLSQPVLAWGCAALIGAVAVVSFHKSNELQHQLNSMRAQMQTQQDAITKDRRVADLLTSPQTQRVALKQPQDATKPEGRVYYQPRQGLLFYAANLPAAPANHVYQIWLVPVDGVPISAGVFQPNNKGEASLVLPALPANVSAKAFAVTVEPAGGVPQPTGAKVLLGLV
jgi:anti-sigma-K factor RskA